MTTVHEKITQLRAKIRENKLNYWLVTRGDAHQHEMVAPSEQRLEWLTKFSGSAGFAVIGLDRVGLFVDGRYKEQAKIECSFEGIEILDFDKTSLQTFLEGKGTVGMDGRFITRSGGLLSKDGLEKNVATLQILEKCLVEEIWQDRPSSVYDLCWLLDGEEPHVEIAQRVVRIRQRLEVSKGRVTALLLGADTSCWLLGVRGNDIAELPIILSRALLVLSENDWRIIWYIEGKVERVALAKEAFVKEVLADKIEIISGIDNFAKHLDGVDAIWVDSCTTNERLVAQCELICKRMYEAGKNIDIIRTITPARIEQTIKREKEKNGFRACHLRDGTMMVKLLYWIANTQDPLDEQTVFDKIDSLRQQVSGYKGPSFSSIVGAGSNGSIIHYRVSKSRNRTLKNGELLLIDCGGHYGDGTTDVTRTVAIGTVDANLSLAYTAVLKSHITLSMQRFPEGTSGSNLDAIARSVLWNRGLDYAHGTGHGVGHVLSVHESPPGISKSAKDTAIVEGMVLSIEPGYYEAGKFGCRIENLVIVEKDPEDGFLKFCAFTCVPYDRNLIITAMLSNEEKIWINHYHDRVFQELANDLPKEERQWLLSATKPI